MNLSTDEHDRYTRWLRHLRKLARLTEKDELYFSPRWYAYWNLGHTAFGAIQQERKRQSCA